MEQLITKFLTNLIQLVILIVGTFGIQFIYHKIGEVKSKKFYNCAKIAVNSAEEIFGGKTGEQKKEYVENFLMSHFKMSKVMCDAIINSAVKELNLVLKKEKLEDTDKTKEQVNNTPTNA